MPKDKVVLVSAILGGAGLARNHQESIDELNRLAEAAEVEVVATFTQNLKKPHTATYLGKGKLKEIASAAKSRHARTLVFNNNLSPSQSRNISDSTKCNVVDRTELILDIFATHASSRQSKLQVELAQLEYAYTKLKQMWKHLSRIQGGIGFRGPGEKQIEVDRREIRRRIGVLKKKLDEIEVTAKTKRKKRKGLTSVSLVGYTNAGKSTLFNRLTKENRFVADQLFATLDSKASSFYSHKNENIMLSDTIGFIKDLPHRLVGSFRSTLLDVREADLLLHVVDVSQDNLFEQIQAVEDVLRELEVDEKNLLTVFNKTDLTSGNHFKFLKKKLLKEYPDCVFISAATGEGIQDLFAKIDHFIECRSRIHIVAIPTEMKKLVAYVYQNTEVVADDFDLDNDCYQIQLKAGFEELESIKKQIEKYQLMRYINS